MSGKDDISLHLYRVLHVGAGSPTTRLREELAPLHGDESLELVGVLGVLGVVRADG